MSDSVKRLLAINALDEFAALPSEVIDFVTALQVKLMEANDEIERLRNGMAGQECHIEAQHQKGLADEDEIERLRDELERIVQWSEAYPLDIFHEPSKEELRKAHEVLTANGMTIDAISASAMRHVTKGVGKIARDALKGNE